MSLSLHILALFERCGAGCDGPLVEMRGQKGTEWGGALENRGMGWGEKWRGTEGDGKQRGTEGTENGKAWRGQKMERHGGGQKTERCGVGCDGERDGPLVEMRG